MGGRTLLVVGALAVAVVGWGGVAQAEELLHLIHTAEVRGTVGICG